MTESRCRRSRAQTKPAQVQTSAGFAFVKSIEQFVWQSPRMKTGATMLIVATPVRKEILSPREFLRLSKESPHLIQRSRFIGPIVGRAGFGGFEVQYSVPMLKRKPT